MAIISISWVDKQTQKGCLAFSRRTEPAIEHNALYSLVIFIDYIGAQIRVIKVMFKDLSFYFYINIFRTIEPKGKFYLIHISHILPNWFLH